MSHKQSLQEPREKRAVAFFDGPNLYRHAKTAFGHHHPNYDPQKLHTTICKRRDWQSSAVRFYTGVPKSEHSPKWRRYWGNRLFAMECKGIHVTKRILQYHSEQVTFPDGSTGKIVRAREKRIDVRLALDMVRGAWLNQYDVAVLFSQDQDLMEAVEEIKAISREQDRWIRLVCAFPDGPNAFPRMGVQGCHESFRMEEDFYNQCLDARDYRQ